MYYCNFVDEEHMLIFSVVVLLSVVDIDSMHCENIHGQ